MTFGKGLAQLRPYDTLGLRNPVKTLQLTLTRRVSLAIVAIATASAAIRFGLSVDVKAPWIAPDEMLYGLIGRGFWHTGRFELFGQQGPFYGFYPVVAGLPLAILGPANGLLTLQAFQAALVSLTPVIAFLWTREMVGARWGIVAGVLTAATPEMARSGLIMTEPVYLPVLTFTLWRLTRALVEPTRRNQIALAAGATIAIAIRLQGVTLLPVIAMSVVVIAIVSGNLRRLGVFLPTVVALGAGLALLYAARFVVDAGGGSLGAYGASAGPGYAVRGVLTWSFREAGDVFLLSVGFPLIAVFALLIWQVGARHRDAAVVSLVVVSLIYCLVTVIQVGAFASVNVHQLAERDVSSVAPPLLVAFCVWLGHGMPRRPILTAVVAWLVGACALLLPVQSLMTDRAVPDGFMTAPWVELADRASSTTLVATWSLAVAAVVLLAVFTPRRGALSLAAIVFLALVGSSFSAQHELDRRSQFDRSDFFGHNQPQWIDRTAKGAVTYLDDGGPLWNGLWHEAFWNTRIDRVASISSPAAPPKTGISAVQISPDGRLVSRTGGGTVFNNLVVASSRLTFDGQRLNVITQGRDEPGLGLWRLSQPPTVSTETNNLLPNHDITSPVNTVVFGCRPGRLSISLFARQGVPGVQQGTPGVELSVDNQRAAEAIVKPGHLWQFQIAAPAQADGHQRCVFRIVPEGLLGATRIAFTPSKTTPHGHAVVFRSSGEDTSEVWEERGRRLPTARSVLYCLYGHPIKLRPQRPLSRLIADEAVLANFIDEEGLSCRQPPTGDVIDGYATHDMHVPAGIYPFYHPVSQP